jgi:DNA polymerase-1
MKLLLIDAYALIYRSYYAFLKNPRINSKGMNTSAIFGFVNILEDVMKRIDPTHVAVGFDPPGPTFRHEAFDAYKAKREKTPEDIRKSTPYIREIINAYNIPIIEAPRYEADDVIGTIAKQAESYGFIVYMMTPDKDYAQLVSESIYQYRPRFGGDYETLGVKETLAKYSLQSISQITDLLGLMGDKSDNIPGCPGVGEKTAQKLLTKYGSVEKLLADTSQLKPALKVSVEENKEMILFSKFLATIVTDAPVQFDPAACLRSKPNFNRLAEIYTDLELRSFLNKLPIATPTATPTQPQPATASATTSATPPTAPQKNIQLSLFEDINDDDGTQSRHCEERSNPELQVPRHCEERSNPETVDCFTSVRNDEKKDVRSDVKEGAPTDPVAPDNPVIARNEAIQKNQTNNQTYHLAETQEKIQTLIQTLEKEKNIAFDTETDGTDAVTANLVGMSFAIRENEAWYVPAPDSFEETKQLMAQFKPLLENENIEKTGQNIKFDILVIRKYGVKVKGKLFDTMIAHYVLNPELRHGMDYLAETYLNYKPIPIESLIGEKGKNQLSMRDVPLDKIAKYAAEDADITLRLRNYFEPELRRSQMEDLFHNIEMPLIYALADMEWTGVKIDPEALNKYAVTLTAKLQELEQEIWRLAGEEFNINSARQVGEIFFDKLKITEDKIKKTATGGYSTSEETLEKLRNKHPIVGLLLDYRGVKKLLSTYVETLPKLVNPTSGKIHTSFNQAVTSTGRLSSTNPNLQNIPVRDALGREIRKAFIADDDSCVFFAADYSQIELRLMAHLSGDANMIDAFNHGADIHAATAAKIYGVSDDEVTPEMRRKAKTANFGIIYGISAFGLAERLNIPRSEARELIAGYFRTYPQVQEYMDESVRQARDKGYVETIFKRRRFLPDINSNNAVVRGYAERFAINAPVQGSAADIIKIAMARIYQRFEKANLRSKMILQVHDELDFNVLRTEFDQVRTIVLEEMENAITLKVPLIADAKAGPSWFEAH